MTDLIHITKLATRRDKSQSQLYAEIRQAVKSGATLEAVGKAAGLSRQRIHQIVKEEEK